MKIVTNAGLTNQRLDVINGIALAYIFNATFVLPHLSQHFLIEEKEKVAFDTIFDVQVLRNKLKGVVRVLTHLPRKVASADAERLPVMHMKEYPQDGKNHMDHSLLQLYNNFKEFVTARSVSRLTIPFRIWRPQSVEEWNLWSTINRALHFNSTIKAKADKIKEYLGDPYISVHVRREEFFQLTGKDSLTPEELALWLNKTVLPQYRQATTVYVHSGETPVSITKPFENIGFKRTVTWHDVLGDASPLPSQIQAAIDYLVAKDASFYLANTVHSTFDFMCYLDRERYQAPKIGATTCQPYHKNRPDSGPLFGLKWLVPYCDGSHQRALNSVISNSLKLKNLIL